MTLYRQPWHSQHSIRLICSLVLYNKCSLTYKLFKSVIEMIALYLHAQLWSMKDTDVLCLHFAVNYRHLMCQSKHILGMLGFSEKLNYAS